MKPTLRDIAERANVSPATVSNALNGRGGVSKTVQENILALAQEMGYQVGKETARTGRHVRLIVYKTHGKVIKYNQFFSEIMESIQLECYRSGLELLISHVSAQDRTDSADQVSWFRNEECAGMILLGTEMRAEELAPFMGARSPLVVLDNLFRLENVHAVAMDNWQAGYLAGKALMDAGLRDIHHITSTIPFNNMEERRRGLRDALEDQGLTLGEDRIWSVRTAMEEAYEDMRALLAKRGKPPEAFFAGNDSMAIGCMRALVEAGYSVPEDVSIIGMDDTSICLACTPQLSTIHVDTQELGRTTVRMLTSLSEEEGAALCPLKVTVGVRLVMRGTVRV